MLASEFWLVHHELPPRGVDSVCYFNRSCVVEACGPSKVFDRVLIRQDLYIHVVYLGLCIFTPPPSSGCVAEDFRFIWVQFESSFPGCCVEAV